MKRSAIVLFVLSACASATNVAPAGSGIAGVATIGPSCPVQIAGSPCPDQPHEVELTIVNVDSGETVTTVRSDANGRFEVALEPGRYRIVPPPQKGPGGAQPVEVVVEPGRFSEARVRFDSGIR